MRTKIYILNRLSDLLTSAILYILPQAFFSKALKAKTRSLAIDCALEKDAKSRLRQYNVLPLGDTHAMREVIEGLKSNDTRTKLSKSERLQYRHNVYQSVITCIEQLVKIIGGCDEIRNGHYEDLLRLFKHDLSESDIVSEQTGYAITALWNDKSIKTEFQSHCETEWASSASYFFDNILRHTAPGFLPTESDILHSRKGFQGGITELRFDFPTLSLNFLDIRLGGERRKWIHQVDDIPVIIFVVDLCTYDSVLSGYNTLEDMVMLFGQMVDREMWREVTFVVLFSGVSEFKKKLGRVEFGAYFQDYNRGNHIGDDVERVKKYLVKRFVEVNTKEAWIRVAFVDPGEQGMAGVVGDALRDRLRGREA